MEMEDHQHQHQHQQYGGMTDLRQLVSNNGARSTHFATSIAAQPTAELFPGHPNLAAAQHHQQHYEMMMFGRQVADLMPRCLHEFGDVNNNASSIGVGTATTPTTTTSASTPPLSGLGGAEGPGCLGGDASTGRWPRQETLTLLEIRSRLDPKFKEANQKGPLWDEVSRIMSEEHGYQRSGKKCREKFENLYKYYKKTKEGKAGRQDGKHYRFFRQLEALYGENNTNATASAQETNFGGSTTLHYQTNTHAFNSHINQEMLLLGSQNSLSLTNSTEFETTSSDDDDHNSTGGVKEKNDESTDKRRKRGGTKSWKVKIKDFIDLQMRKLVQKQEEWLDKLMKTLEQKEKERVLREEEWRRQEAARLEREHKFWAKERAWIEARDAALMEALHKLTGTATDQVKSHHHHHHHDGIIMQNEEHNNNEDGENWQECEISRLVQLRAEIMETRFRQGGGGGGCSEEGLWEEIATKMACFGYERSSTKLKEKWETISKGNNKKKRKENNPTNSVRSSTSCFYIENNNNNNDHYSSSSSLYNNNNHHHGYCDINNDQRRQQQQSPSNSNANASVHQAENCFPFLMGCEGGTLWDNYSLKVNKPNQNQ